MSRRYAVVEGDEVVNVILWDGETPYTPPKGAVLMPLEKMPSEAGLGSKIDEKGAVSAHVPDYWERKRNMGASDAASEVEQPERSRK